EPLVAEATESAEASKPTKAAEAKASTRGRVGIPVALTEDVLRVLLRHASPGRGVGDQDVQPGRPCGGVAAVHGLGRLRGEALDVGDVGAGHAAGGGIVGGDITRAVLRNPGQPAW